MNADSYPSDEFVLITFHSSLENLAVKASTNKPAFLLKLKQHAKPSRYLFPTMKIFWKWKKITACRFAGITSHALN